MINEQLAIEILRQYAREAAKTLIADGFTRWLYRGDTMMCRSFGASDDSYEEAINELQRLRQCLGGDEIDRIFEEAKQEYGREVDSELWAKYRNKEQPPERSLSHDEHLPWDDDLESLPL